MEMKIYEAINKIQAALAKTGISKDRKNQQQGYAFRGIDDVYGALAPLLAEHKVCVFPRYTERQLQVRTTNKGTDMYDVVVRGEFDFVSAEDGSKHTCCTFGEAMDTADKATNKAMSAAYKYACLQVFCIPTEGDNDADAHTPENTTIKFPPEMTNKQVLDNQTRPLSEKAKKDIKAAQTIADLTAVYNAYCTTEPILELKQACGERKEQLSSGAGL